MDVRRAEERRRLRVLLSVTAAIAAVAATLGVLHTPLWKVRHVRISGGGGVVSTETLLRAAGLTGTVPMVDVDAERDVRRLQGLPDVAGAAVSRDWPSTVRIVVTIRTPVAVLVAGSYRLALDRTGRVLAAGPTAGPGLPAVELPSGGGTPAVADGGRSSEPGSTSAVSTSSSAASAGSAGSVVAGSVVAGPGAWVPRLFLPGSWLPGGAGPGASALALTAPGAAAPPAGDTLGAELALAAVLSGGLRSEVASIAVVPGVGLVATVGGATVGVVTAIFGPATELAAKAEGLAAVLRQGPATGARTIDLRVPDRPVVVPGPGS